jgi:hypothetical protein
MIRYIVVCILNGLFFGILDGLINANPFARKLFEIYKPISRTSINAAAGLVIDLIYGFVMGGIFLMMYNSLPGASGPEKGINFALIIWFFRVVMGVVSSWMMFTVPVNTLLYTAVTGLIEMILIGLVFGLFLKPF